MLTAALLLALTVPATVTSVYDGDTIKVQAEIWPGITWAGSVRVLGVDTPEIRGKCPEEKAAAIAAREFVKLTIRKHSIGDEVVLHNVKLGKFAGRVLADVEFYDGTVTLTDDGIVEVVRRDLAELLIAEGHARPYDGGARQGWCE